MSLNQVKDTTTDNPAPYTIENDGNLQSNVTVWSTDLWESASIGLYPLPGGKPGVPNEYFQFMMDDNDPDPWIWALNQSWVNMTNTSATAILAAYGSRWQNTSDKYEVEIRLHVPDDEPPGSKDTTTTITCQQNETY